MEVVLKKIPYVCLGGRNLVGRNLMGSQMCLDIISQKIESVFPNTELGRAVSPPTPDLGVLQSSGCLDGPG